MSSPSLAARNNEVSPNDPFATPTLNPTELPTPPEAAVQRHDSTQWPPYETTVGPAHKTTSLSSAGSGSHLSSVYLEKSRNPERNSAHGKQKQKRASRDPEKGDPAREFHNQRPRGAPIENDDDDEEDDPRILQERKAVHILLFLSGPCVLLSFLNALWTIISLFVTSMTQPVRLCARRPGFGQQLGGLLGPSLNLQLRSIYTPLPPHANEDFTYHTGSLVLVQLLSPFMSLGMMAAAWVVAVFWVLTMIVGDPAGLDKRDDGKESVMAIRNWWEGWLVRSISLE